MPGSAPTGWQAPKTDWSAEDAPVPFDFNRQEGNTSAIETGDRTIDPTRAPASNVGTLRNLLDWFANRIKAITGAVNWWDAPAATIAWIKTWIDGHGPTGDPHSQYALDTDLSAHQTSATIDHPDGSVTLAKIASAAKTTDGGTEANRLAVTGVNGRVGDAGKLGGASADIAANANTIAKRDASGGLSSTFWVPSGLTGATAASRYVGATASGAPASGTFAVGDYVIDQSGQIWVCTAAGSPGTWKSMSPVNTQIFTSSGTWTKPAGVSLVLVDAISGGGGGQTSSGYDGGAGGGGGGRCQRLLPATAVGATESIQVGAGGAVGAGGGNTAFGSHLVILGGEKGAGTINSSGGGIARPHPTIPGDDVGGFGAVGAKQNDPGEWGGGGGGRGLNGEGWGGGDSLFGAGGGGGGSNDAYPGGAGGGVGSYLRGSGPAGGAVKAAGAAGANGNLVYCGQGGQGGSSGNKPGGAGGIPGGGGGGGGYLGGAGASGARGEVRVYAW